jgi:tRNA-2-methylthio-N6-dimethylallyladenosine synthase
MSEKYHLVTYGCQMNEYDSNMVAEMLENRGIESTSDEREADYIIMNTCSIREKAEDTAFNKLRQYGALKRKKKHLKVGVIGCMAKNKGAELPDSLNHIDYVLGPDNYNDLEDVLFGEEDGKIRVKDAKIITEFDEVENYKGRHAKISSSYSTFVTIQRGCNKRCTYCIVPFVRGNEKYRAIDEVLDEVKHAVDQGVSEVTLLGQTVNSYNFPGENFASLLGKVSDIEGVKRIRFTSPHPKHFTDDVIWMMKDRENICNHVHLPVQSGSDKMLKDMRRQYDREKFLEIAHKLRAIDPNFAISTDAIVGYVGETEQDFEDTVSIFEEVRFDTAFMFAYSPRKGTKSFGEEEFITQDEKIARLNRLIEVQNKITLETNTAMIGKSAELLIEGISPRSDQEVIGKTDCFKKVIIPKGDLKTGDYAKVIIDDIRGWTLRGKRA